MFTKLWRILKWPVVFSGIFFNIWTMVLIQEENCINQCTVSALGLKTKAPLFFTFLWLKWEVHRVELHTKKSSFPHSTSSSPTSGAVILAVGTCWCAVQTSLWGLVVQLLDVLSVGSLQPPGPLGIAFMQRRIQGEA